MRKIDLTATPIEVDGFTVETKDLYTKYSENNTIIYEYIDKGNINFEAHDSFEVGGGTTGEKTALTFSNICKVPKYGTLDVDPYSIGYSLFDSTETLKEIYTKPFIMATDVGPTLFHHLRYKTGRPLYNVYGYDAKLLSLNGVFSSILNPIFKNPVILTVTRWVDPLLANRLMDTRIIRSKQLCGDYWIDSDGTAYNLSTGMMKMKLIKIS